MAVKIVKPNAPFIPIPGGCRAVVRQSYMGRQYVNIVGLANPEQNTTTFIGAARALFEHWQALFVPLLSDKWTLDSVETRDLNTESSPVELYSVAGVQGNDETFALPRGVAMVLQLTTGGAGRARHGRIFLSGICESSFENMDNTFKPSIVDPITTGLIAGLGNFVGAGAFSRMGLAVLSHSRAPDGTKRVASVYNEVTNTWDGPQGPGSAHNVTGISVRKLAASQRRRNG